MPEVTLASTRDNDAFQVDPRLPDKIRLFILAETGNLELVIIGGLADGETKLLVPSTIAISYAQAMREKLNLPSWCLPSSLVRVCLFRFFAQSCGTIRVLLAHRLPVRKILCPIEHRNQCPNLGPVDRLVCVNPSRVGLCDFGSHGGLIESSLALCRR